MDELYLKHRPKKYDDVIGQQTACSTLKRFDKKGYPHAILLTGPSGCGKTTIARIIKNKLKCGDYDYKEVNTADFRGIDSIRSIRQKAALAPITGKTRMWLIDECHKLSNDAQNALLKLLEDAPKQTYFVLATTHPNKLINTIKTRCTELAIKSLTDKQVYKLLQNIAGKENFKLNKKVAKKIIKNSEGSARKALVLLNSILSLINTNDMLKTIAESTKEEEGIKLARALHNPGVKWNEVAGILKQLKDTEEAESVRRLVLSYATSVLLSNGKLTPRAFLIIDSFRDAFYDSGKAGLAAACYEIYSSE